MTVPDERTRALKHTRDFLYSLLDPKRTPRVPKEIRQRARSCLKHYPGDLYLEVTQRRLPEIWGVHADD